MKLLQSCLNLLRKVRIVMYPLNEELTVEELAKELHEAGREAVEKNCIVRRDVPTKGFIEWNDLDELAKEGRLIQARFLIKRNSIRPRD